MLLWRWCILKIQAFCRYLHIHISIVLIERLVPCDEWRLVLLKWKWRNFCLRIGMGKHSYWSVTMQKWMSLMYVFICKFKSVTVSYSVLMTVKNSLQRCHYDNGDVTNGDVAMTVENSLKLDSCGTLTMRKPITQVSLRQWGIHLRYKQTAGSGRKVVDTTQNTCDENTYRTKHCDEGQSNPWDAGMK